MKIGQSVKTEAAHHVKELDVGIYGNVDIESTSIRYAEYFSMRDIRLANMVLEVFVFKALWVGDRWLGLGK